MELRKIWFPLVVAALWVVMSAVTLSGFAGFSGAARAQQAELNKPHAVAAPAAAEGRRGPITQRW